MATAIAASIVAIGGFFDQDATAIGDSRTISLYYTHTKDSLNITYKKNGYYDRDALKQLNYFLRDWRRDEPIDMDPKLFDVLWEVYREAGYEGQTINVVSAYRSPETNEMLRRRSRAVAKYSQHTLGKAMDTTMPGVGMGKIREIGMRLQRGGVGYYPTAGTPFVHLDVGSVRSWPRMSTSQLVSLFPDQKTVHLPSDGPPLAGYQEALAEIQRNGGSVGGGGDEEEGIVPSFLAAIFGGGSKSTQVASRSRPAQSQTLAYSNSNSGTSGDGLGVQAFLATDGLAPRSEPQTQSRSRSGRVKAEAPIVVASNAPQPAPVETAAPVPVAVQPQPVIRPQSVVEVAEPRPVLDLSAPKDAVVPLPPKRPGDLLIAALPTTNAPLPPARPPELAAAPVSSLQLASAENSAKPENAARTVPLPPLLDRQQVPTQALGYATTASVASFIPLPPLRGTNAAPQTTVKLIPVPSAERQPALRQAVASNAIASNAVASNDVRPAAPTPRPASQKPAPIQVASLAKDGLVATRFESNATERLSVGKFTAGMTRPLGASFVQHNTD